MAKEHKDPIRLWFWLIPGPNGKPRGSRYRMTDETALEHFKGKAVKLEETEEVRHSVGCTSDFLKK
jgi:hypothetical protein